MFTQDIPKELEKRIQRAIESHGGALPERDALVWHGYLAGLLEWGLLTPAEHAHLTVLLPRIEQNPVVAILLGDFESGPT